MKACSLASLKRLSRFAGCGALAFVAGCGSSGGMAGSGGAGGANQTGSGGSGGVTGSGGAPEQTGGSSGSGGSPNDDGGSGGAVGTGGAGGAGTAGGGGNGGGGAAGGFTLPAGAPATVHMDGAALAMAQKSLAGGGGGSAAQKAALANLVAAAQAALKAGTWSVTTKAATYVINNDPHLYVSWGPYLWPPDANPPSGLGTLTRCPYVNHDGVRNPTVDMITDRHGLHAGSEAIWQLALAWYLTGDPAYADEAELIARTWYLNAATSMKPEMTYAQRPGPCANGTAAGIIEASGGFMIDALDGLSILALDTRANGWTAADQTGLKAWMTQFLSWLHTSALGQSEGGGANNHGTWYDALTAGIDLYLGDGAGATAIANASKQKRIDPQIMADGSMPQELARTTSWHYTGYNNAAFCHLAETAKRAGVDLWSYQSAAGGSIVKAINFMIPTATTANPPGPWAQYNDITKPFDKDYQADAYYLVQAAAQYGNSAPAKAVIAMSPIPIEVPGHNCAGTNYPVGSAFCAISKGAGAYVDLQPAGTPAVDMWPLIPVCRLQVN
ncbi:MAG TPA: alginate lyase family protein [Polyangia bacterium]|jgi:hypothetical protein